MLAQYLSYNTKWLSYIEYFLYRLDKIKIDFENYHLINVTLFQPTFNPAKFNAMIHFVQCIWNHGSARNCDIAYSEVAPKYFFKVFNRRTNKKEYKLQILEYNIKHINVIGMQNTIIIAKVSVRSFKKNLLLISSIQRLHGYAILQIFCGSILCI